MIGPNLRYSNRRPSSKAGAWYLKMKSKSERTKIYSKENCFYESTFIK